MNNITEQLNILKKAFPKAKIEIPKGFKSMAVYNANAEYEQIIPHWTLIGKDYNDAVQKVLDALKKSRPFYNYREGRIGSEYLKQSDKKILVTDQFENTTYVIPVQTGMRWKGKSVETVRKEAAPGEILLGAYEVAIMLLTHPDRLKEYSDLWIDCPGDEYADGEFVSAPLFDLGDGGLEFSAHWVDDADDNYGSASAFLNTGSVNDLTKKNKENSIKSWKLTLQQSQVSNIDIIQSGQDVIVKLPKATKIMVEEE